MSLFDCDEGLTFSVKCNGIQIELDRTSGMRAIIRSQRKKDWGLVSLKHTQLSLKFSWEETTESDLLKFEKLRHWQEKQQHLFKHWSSRADRACSFLAKHLCQSGFQQLHKMRLQALKHGSGFYSTCGTTVEWFEKQLRQDWSRNFSSGE